MSQVAEQKSLDLSSDTIDLSPEAVRQAPRSLDVSPAAQALRKCSHMSFAKGFFIGSGLGLLLIPATFLAGLAGEAFAKAFIVAPRVAEFAQPMAGFPTADAASVADDLAVTTGE